jgi:transcriptional regulator with XRE-family HTH domain
MTHRQELATALRKQRQAAGLTLKQLSQQCGLSISYLSDLERSIRDPRLETLERIGDVYGLELYIGWRRKEGNHD